MGLADAFSKEDRVEITVTQLYAIMKGVTERDVILRGIVNRVPHEHIETLVYGDIKPAKEADAK